jgi:hypothetical protein
MIDIKDLKRAIAISEKLESLRAELNSLLGLGFSSSVPAKRGRKPKIINLEAESVPVAPTRKKRRKLSPEALEKIREGQRRRWAKVHKEQKKSEK